MSVAGTRAHPAGNPDGGGLDPGTRTVVDGFAVAVGRCPDRIAVSHGPTGLTYAELDAAVTRLAGEILALVPGPGAPVALLLPRSLEMVIAAIATVRAGASYIPLDPSGPAARLEMILDDASPALVVTTVQAAHRLPGHMATLLLDDPARPTAGTPAGPFPAAEPDRTAYTIFTSGTTGRPKGVQVSHHNLVRLFTATRSLFRFGCDDVWSMFHSFAFDVSVWEMWGALLHGARLVVVPESTVRDPHAFRALLRDERVTVLSQTPTAFRMLVDEETCWADKLPLRLVVFGGEALTFTDLGPWMDRYGDDAPELVNMYGITEITVHATYRRVRADEVAERRSMIGVPLPDLDIVLVDERLRPVPDGQVGEIVVTGAGVAIGYLGPPELTRQRFLDLLDARGRPVRGYRSGDLARRHPDGDLEYLGRADEQVKIRGFRVELGEVEHALRRHPSVRRAVATTQAPAGGEPVVVAYVVPAGTAMPGQAELRAHLTGWLPEYMVPAAIGVLDTLPMTVNGKIDRARLPRLPRLPSAEPTGAAAARPRTPVEELLCELFAQALGRTGVGLDDDLFELGGHSLTAIRLVNRVRSVLGWQLQVTDLFEARTPAALIRRAGRSAASGDGSRPALTARDRGSESPLSYAQRRLWFLHQIHGANPAYHIPHALYLTGAVNPDALAAAARDVVLRHEILRTVYLDRDGEPVQRTLAPTEVGRCLIVRRVPAERVDEVVTASTRRPFDLRADLPMRAELLLVDESSSVLVLTLHHIAADGWSLEPLVRDLGEAYRARLAGDEPVFRPLPVQYADFAAWQRELLGDAADPHSLAGRELRYWSRLLDGVPEELDLPTDRPRPAVSSFAGEMLPLAVGVGGHAELVDLARAAGATVNMVLQAAVAALLTRLGAGSDVPIGTAVAGRVDEALHELVGFFVNTVVTRTDTSGDPSFAELLRRVRTGNLAAFEHSNLPFERLVEMLNPVRSPARHPLAQVMLGAQNDIPAGELLAGLTVRARPVGTGTAKFDLSFKFAERRGADGTPLGIDGALEYSADLFDRASAERMVQRLVALLAEVARRPDVPLSRIDILLPGEREHLVRDGNAAHEPVPAPSTVALLVEEQVDRTPGHVAVIQGERRWTYRELDDQANRVAHLLRGLGVGAGSRVGVLYRPGLPVVAAMLGVWKAGAAYVPTDPDDPPQRRGYVLGDSGATLLLTEAGLVDDLELPATVPVVATDTDPRLPEQPTTRLPHQDDPRSLAYVVYTSGSTGRPKGVLLEHAGVVQRLRDVRTHFGLTAADRNLQLISLGFEAPAREIFGPLSVGASVVMPPPLRPRDPETVIEVIRESRPTTIVCVVPSMLEALLAGDAGGADVASLRVVGTGGETLRPREARVLIDQWKCEVINQFGPTETTMMACLHRVRPADLASRIPVGRPLTNTRVYVLDRALNPAPVGVPGEVYLAGLGVGRGYTGRPALSAARFVADPYGPPGERMYRSGDVGRWLSDGTLDLLGRADDQVKIRGFRVELGEIEAVLAGHPRVGRAAVIVREDRPGDRRLTAYLVPANPAEPPLPAQLRDHLSRHLPDHMIPAAFVVLPALPLRGNGKLNRDLLPVPEVSSAVTGRPPRTPREELLCELFAEALGRPAVSIDDDFFLLGGHSLLAARLIGRVRRTLGIDLAMRTIFEAPTVAGLAERAGLDSTDDGLDVMLPLRAGGDRPPLFCIHPGGGLSWGYAGLLRHIPADVPLYGVQARGLLHPDDMPATVEEMAADYLARIREVRPHGPYRLLGWSFGGLVAYEIAVGLQARGETVELLALMDCYPGVPVHYRIDSRTMLASLLDPDRPHDIPAEGSADLARAVAMIKQDGGALAGLDESRVRAILRVMAHNRRMVADYLPAGRFTGHIVFFLATEGRVPDAPPPEVWHRYVSGRVIWYPVRATHTTMTSAEALAEIGRTVESTLTRCDVHASPARCEEERA